MNLDLDEEFLFHVGIHFDDIMMDRISPDAIADSMVKEVYIWSTDYYQKYQETPSIDILELEFVRHNLTFSPPQTQLEDLLGRLRSRYIENQAKHSILDVGKMAIRDPKGLPRRMIEEGRRLDRVLTSGKDLFDNSSIDQAILSYHKRVAKGRGPSIGFDEMDTHFDGLEALSFLISPPGGGKSWITTKSMLENILVGRTVYLAGLEMPKQVYQWRLYCMAAKIPFWKYLKRQMEPEDISAIKAKAEELAQYANFYIEKPPMGERTPEYIYSKAQQLQADIIYIDQLQNVETKNGVAIGAINRTEDFFAVCNVFMDLSDDIPIWINHQFNRSVLNSDGFPEMQQIKNSAAIEETATLALALYSNRAMKQDQIIQFGTLKSRNYSHAIWEIKMNMNRGCSLDLLGRAQN